MKDKPLFSPSRIFSAIKMWLWWVAVMEVDIPFWKFIRYYGRINASHKDGWY